MTPLLEDPTVPIMSKRPTTGGFHQPSRRITLCGKVLTADSTVSQESDVKELLRRLRGAIGMGLTWAIGGILVGGGIELIHNIWPNPLGAAVDIWPAVLAFPGFFGGIAFSAVLGVVGRRRRFDELSMSGMAAMGAVGGLMVSLIPAAMVGLGLATPNVPVWEITLALLGPFTLGGALAASGTLGLARLADDQSLLAEGEEVADVGLTTEEAERLLGGQD